MKRNRKGLIHYLSKYCFFSDYLAHLVEISSYLIEDSNKEHICLLCIQPASFTQDLGDVLGQGGADSWGKGLDETERDDKKPPSELRAGPRRGKEGRKLNSSYS